MKKVWLLIISLILLCMLLVACDKGADTPALDNNPPVHEHTVVIDNAVAATCKEAGFTAGAHCSECGEILVKQEAVSKLDHTLVIDEAVESTCDKAGLTAGAHCSECGDILVKQEVVASLKHTVVVDEAVESTCTKAGLTSGAHCSECGKIFKEQIEVSLKAHTYDDKYDAFCNVCGHERDAECAHTELETITGNPATCVVEGLTDGKKCTKCGEITVAQEIIPTNDDHSFENRICKDCGAIENVDDDTSTTDHIWSLAYEWNLIDGLWKCIATRICENDSSHFEILEAVVTSEIKYNSGCSYDGVTTYTATFSKPWATVQTKDVADIPATGVHYLSISHESYFCGGCGYPSVGDIAFIGNYGDNAFWKLKNGVLTLYPAESVNNVNHDEYWIFGRIGMYDSWQDVYMDFLYEDDKTIPAIHTVIIESGITHILDETLFDVFGSTEFTEIIIPDTVVSIGAYAFAFCNKLTTIHIPNTVKKIGDEAFNSCKNLASIVIPESVTSIGSSAFYGCSSLTSIVIPDSVTSIGSCAFSGCSSLTNIVIPDSVTSIGEYAFCDCSSLTSIVIPDSVTSIGDCAFGWCSNLTSITFEGTIAQWNAISKDSRWNDGTGNYTVYCTDGSIAKDGTVTYN